MIRKSHLTEDTDPILIDFSRSRRYLDPSGKHLPNRRVFFSQNHIFASVNAFREHLGSRRDDIIMLIYSMMYLLDQFQEILSIVKINEIGLYKMNTKCDTFCKGP